MERDIVDIVMNKEYIQLTASEREELKEFCTSEDEFIQLKNVFVSVEEMGAETFTPRAETKERLDQLFDESFPKAAPVWYNSVLSVLVPREKPVHRQPLLQVAAVVLLLFLAVPLMQSDLSSADNIQLAEAEVAASEDVLEEKVVEEVAPAMDVTVLEEESADADTRMAEDPAPPITSTLTAQSSVPVSEHPDGVFIGTLAGAENVAFSMPASESTELLDLLTASF